MEEIQEPQDGIYKGVSAKVDEFLELHPEEWFDFEKITRYYDWRERKSKDALSKKLYYEWKKAEPKLEKRGGKYRLIDRSLNELEWWDGHETETLPLILPLQLHDYAKFHAPCLIVVAGSYNAGKTAYMINTALLNMDWIDTRLFVSEGEQLLKQRLTDYSGYIPKPPPFRTYRRLQDFQDIIAPNSLNIIDYLRVDPDKMYMVQKDLLAIYGKLENGIAVVALQKPPGRNIAYGGVPTAWEPTLYISIDKGIVKFEKIKVPLRPEINPYNLIIQFKLAKGINFYDRHVVYEGVPEEERESMPF